MNDLNHPLVSVSVITYNSSNTILETLESIKTQTYPEIELVISDDCSTDDTVSICQQWLTNNGSRFKRTELIESPTNTGTAANQNRAEKACTGEWVKGIAGDDLLLPKCIEDCMAFAKDNPSLSCFFGKIQAFGGNKEYSEWLTETFSERNDKMSKQSREELLDMIINGNTPPAPAFFYNRVFFIDNQIKNDERIPLIEDLPKWITMLKKGLAFGFIDKVIVMYRVGGISTPNEWQSLEYYRSRRLTHFYYQFDYFYSKDADKAIVDTVTHECEIYSSLLDCQKQLNKIKSSFLYKLTILPYIKIKKIWRK